MLGVLLVQRAGDVMKAVKYMLAGVVALGLVLVGLVLSDRATSSKRKATTPTATTSGEPERAASASRPLPPTVPTSPAPTRAASSPTGRDIKGPLPRNLDEAKAKIPGLREGLERMAPIYREMLGYKLEMVSLVQDCVAGRVKSGYVNVHLQFHITDDDKEYRPIEVDYMNGTLTDEQKELVMKCVQTSFKRPVPVDLSKMQIEPEYQLTTQFRFPVEEDPVYGYAVQVARGTSDGIITQ